jgi:FixJ family two-component response regulator
METPPAKPTVFVVDDDPDMRHALELLVRAMGYRAQAFAAAREFYAQYQPSERGCLVLDVKMPRQNGLELYGRLIREGKRLPVIFITAHADVSIAVAAMKTGAIEFLEKPFEQAVLRDRIERALRLDAQWRERESAYDAIDAKILLLTERELETLDLVIAGDSNKTMAEKLFVSERAVEMRRSNMMRKLGVKSTAELLDLAITHRVLSEVRRARSLEPFMPDDFARDEAS